MTAEIFWIRIATRFVAFATIGGNPKNISMGSVRSEPPPAKVFIKPAIKPHPSIIISVSASIIFYLSK